MIRLISFVKTQIQINLFELSCQSKNLSQFAGFFLSKHTWKWIHLILPVKAQNSTQFSGFFLSKSKFDLKKYNICQITNSNKFVWIFTSKQKFKSICWIFPVKTQLQMYLFDFTCQNTKSIFWILSQKVDLIWKKREK